MLFLIAIIGVFYFVIPAHFINGQEPVSDAIKNDGAIYSSSANGTRLKVDATQPPTFTVTVDQKTTTSARLTYAPGDAHSGLNSES